jgi:hypothetical protein
MPDKKIEKPAQLSTYQTLDDVQKSYLYGLPADYYANNKKLVGSINSIVQDAIAQSDRKLSRSTPSIMVGAVQQAKAQERSDIKKQDDDQVKYLTGIRGLTETSKDMDLFRELFPIATPAFELFHEYDMIYDMIPEGAKCFNILKNSVLSADNFSKKYLIPRYDDIRLVTNPDSENATDVKNLNIIKDIIEEYDLNAQIDDFVNDAMKYGAKPVMVVKIDDNFRKAAARVLKMESNDVSSVYRDMYSHGHKVTLESNISDSDFITAEDAKEDTETIGQPNPEKASRFSLDMDAYIDELALLYEDALEHEEIMTMESVLTEEQKKLHKSNMDKRKAELKRLKTKKNRKQVMKEMCQTINNLVNTNVKFSIASESVTLKSISAIANQVKTLRKVKAYESGTSVYNTAGKTIRFEDYYNEHADDLNDDVNFICAQMEGSKFRKSSKKILKKRIIHDKSTGISTESMVCTDTEAYVPYGDMVYESDEVKENRKKPNGSVIIPLQPDQVVPIAINGKHIGYYVIERVGTNDFGSGVATLLGYRHAGNTGFGLAGQLFVNQGMGNSGGGVILRDMIDLPMTVADNTRRTDLLKGMLTRAIAERIGNPAIVDDTAFNSILYSLIKDEYVTNREVRITYVPNYMMVYFAHEIDKNTGIGVSIMKKGLFFAHVYIASLITNLMISIAKSADREQVNIDLGYNSRVEATVQKVIRTLQSKRASVESIGSVDTILRQLGTFHRFISLRYGGSPMVEMETIPGQQIDLDNNSLQDKALKSFVNSFNVPHSAVNILDEQEYARSITLQDGLMLDQVIKLQDPYQTCATKLHRILTQNRHPDKLLTENNIDRVEKDRKTSSEDVENTKKNETISELIDINKVFVDFPAPEGLNIASLNDQTSTVGPFIDMIIDTLLPEYFDPSVTEGQVNVDRVKGVAKLSLYKKYLPGLPYDEFGEIIQNAKAFCEREYIRDKDNGDDPQGGGSFGGASAPSGGGGFGGDSGGGSSGGMDDMGGGMDDLGDMGGMDDLGSI